MGYQILSTDVLEASSRFRSLAARAFIRAEAMGLVPEHTAPVRIADSAREVLRQVVDAARSEGIGRALTEPTNATDPALWEAFVASLLDALEESPIPRTERAGLERVLGADLLAALVSVSPSSLRRYAAGERSMPDDVAARLHWLALVVGDLAGAYNDIGVRRWFARPRIELAGRSPMALLQGEWAPGDNGPSQVRRLADSLLGAAAT